MLDYVNARDYANYQKVQHHKPINYLISHSQNELSLQFK